MGKDEGKVKEESLGKENKKAGERKESQEGCHGQERELSRAKKGQSQLQTEVWERGKGGEEEGAGSALIKPAKLEFSNSE